MQLRIDSDFVRLQDKPSDQNRTILHSKSLNISANCLFFTRNIHRFSDSSFNPKHVVTYTENNLKGYVVCFRQHCFV